ncbi:transcriptional regulator, TetR family [Paenibacillus sp. UNC496MF]|nr:transcriptional regulator, TetR family [Paenibacillus sp. UNC496MF]
MGKGTAPKPRGLRDSPFFRVGDFNVHKWQVFTIAGTLTLGSSICHTKGMETRKLQIIRFTESLIQQKGYAAFSYDDLAKHFGVTKASIHYHFEKKEDLGLAVLERLYQRLLAFSARMAISQEPVEEKLARFSKLQMEELADDVICPISSLQADFELLPDSMRMKLQAISRLELSVMQGIIADGASGLGTDSRAVALAVLAAIKGSLQYRRVLGEDPGPDIMDGICRILTRS